MKRAGVLLFVVAVAAALVPTATTGAAAGAPPVGTTLLARTLPGQYSFVVPAGVHAIAYDLCGAAGGIGGDAQSSDRGGNGDHVVGLLEVRPGETLGVWVGGKGQQGGSAASGGAGGAGGFNGGGAGGPGGTAPNNNAGQPGGPGGGGGGGATDIRRSGVAPANRIVVASGGGGNGGAHYRITIDSSFQLTRETYFLDPGVYEAVEDDGGAGTKNAPDGGYTPGKGWPWYGPPNYDIAQGQSNKARREPYIYRMPDSIDAASDWMETGRGTNNQVGGRGGRGGRVGVRRTSDGFVFVDVYLAGGGGGGGGRVGGGGAGGGFGVIGPVAHIYGIPGPPEPTFPVRIEGYGAGGGGGGSSLVPLRGRGNVDNACGGHGRATLKVARDVPAAPSFVAAASGGTSGAAAVGFGTPPDDGIAPITGYEASCRSPGRATKTATGTGTFIVVRGVSNGVTYACVARAKNGYGFGAQTSPGALVRVGAPAAPPQVSAFPGPGFGQITVSWGAAVSKAAPVTSYAVVCAAPGSSKTVTGTASTRKKVIGGLVRGPQHTCTVTARNRFGTGIGRSATAPAA